MPFNVDDKIITRGVIASLQLSACNYAKIELFFLKKDLNSFFVISFVIEIKSKEIMELSFKLSFDFFECESIFFHLWLFKLAVALNYYSVCHFTCQTIVDKRNNKIIKYHTKSKYCSFCKSSMHFPKKNRRWLWQWMLIWENE